MQVNIRLDMDKKILGENALSKCSRTFVSKCSTKSSYRYILKRFVFFKPFDGFQS